MCSDGIFKIKRNEWINTSENITKASKQNKQTNKANTINKNYKEDVWNKYKKKIIIK